MSNFTIDPETHLGPVHLIVADLGASVPFYRDALGLALVERAGGHATLGAGDVPIVVLQELPGARRRPRNTTGLYHFAILFPSRADLARAVRRLAEVGYPVGGASDHLVSEAVYLDDPDGNGIEIYADRPRESWPRSGDQIAMATNPLDFDSLMGELRGSDEPWRGAPGGTRLGHVHLHVADLPRAVAFYRDVLGFDLMARYGAQAAFLSAGGYHHHIGVNTWAGVGAPPAPEGSAGLEYFEVYLPSRASVDSEARRASKLGVQALERDDGLMLRDPSGNALFLTVEPDASRRAA